MPEVKILKVARTFEEEKVIFVSTQSCHYNGIAAVAEESTATTLSEDEEVVEDEEYLLAVNNNNSSSVCVSFFLTYPQSVVIAQTDPTGVVSTIAGKCVAGCVTVTIDNRTSIFSSCEFGYIRFDKVNGQCPSLGDFSATGNLQASINACKSIGKCILRPNIKVTKEQLRMFSTVAAVRTATKRMYYYGARPVVWPKKKGIVVQLLLIGYRIFKHIAGTAKKIVGHLKQHAGKVVKHIADRFKRFKRSNNLRRKYFKTSRRSKNSNKYRFFKRL